MNKSLARTLTLVSILLVEGGGIFFALGFRHSPIVTQHGAAMAGGSLHPLLALLGVLFLFFALCLSIIAWIGSLIRMAQLGRWGWFVCLLVFSEITLLLYIFWGPRTSLRPLATTSVVPYRSFNEY